MSENNSLFDASPANASTSEPTDDDENTDGRTESPDTELTWHKDDSPIEHLFGQASLASLLNFAMRSVEEEEVRGYNKSELASAAGVSRHAVHDHIDDLVALGIYNEVGANIKRYRPNANSTVIESMANLDECIRRHNVYL